MSEESTGVDSEESRGLSRRNALKAGVATGVGVAAWSGMSITSLGGTPAYASACSGLGPPIPLLDCRNTDQGNCSSVRYHTLKNVPFPYEVTHNIVDNSGICCDKFGPNPPPGGTDTAFPQFLFPGTSHPVSGQANQKCTVFMEFYIGGDTSCENRNLNNRTGWIKYGPSTTGIINIFDPTAATGSCPLGSTGPCPEFSTSGTKMTIFAICTAADFPDSCFTLT